jgi:hypothetical protein
MRPMSRRHGPRHGLLARPTGGTARQAACRHGPVPRVVHGPPAWSMTRHGHGTAKRPARRLAPSPTRPSAHAYINPPPRRGHPHPNPNPIPILPPAVVYSTTRLRLFVFVSLRSDTPPSLVGRLLTLSSPDQLCSGDLALLPQSLSYLSFH